MISRSRDSDHIHVWEIIGEELNNIMHTFGYHVHPHSTTSVTTEPYIGFFPCDVQCALLASRKST